MPLSIVLKLSNSITSVGNSKVYSYFSYHLIVHRCSLLPAGYRIEDEWLHLKRDQLSSQVFEDEFDLAMALIEGVEARGEQRGYAVERF